MGKGSWGRKTIYCTKYFVISHVKREVLKQVSKQIQSKLKGKEEHPFLTTHNDLVELTAARCCEATNRFKEGFDNVACYRLKAFKLEMK